MTAATPSIGDWIQVRVGPAKMFYRARVLHTDMLANLYVIRFEEDLLNLDLDGPLFHGRGREFYGKALVEIVEDAADGIMTKDDEDEV